MELFLFEFRWKFDIRFVDFARFGKLITFYGFLVGTFGGFYWEPRFMAN
jgi:hypothetical protein